MVAIEIPEAVWTGLTIVILVAVGAFIRDYYIQRGRFQRLEEEFAVVRGLIAGKKAPEEEKKLEEKKG